MTDDRSLRQLDKKVPNFNVNIGVDLSLDI